MTSWQLSYNLSCVRPKPQYACHSRPLAGHISGWCTFSDMLLLWMFHICVKLSSDNVKEEKECSENYRDLKSFREVKKISIQFSWGGFSSSTFCLSNGGQHGQQTGGCQVVCLLCCAQAGGCGGDSSAGSSQFRLPCCSWLGWGDLPICCLLGPLDCWKSGHNIFTWRACQKDLEW